MKLYIKSKMILVILPLLIGSFTINGYISILTMRSSLLDKSSHLTNYKMNQFMNYSQQQWKNLSNSDFADDPVYIKIVEESLALFAREMVNSDYEYIFALNSKGNLPFSTSDEEYFISHLNDLSSSKPYKKSHLQLYTLGDREYLGISRYLEALDWDIYIIDDKQSVSDDLSKLMSRQILNSLISLLGIIFAMIITLGNIVAPIRRFRETIHKITETQSFSRQVRIEYPDEIGDLAYDFNNMSRNIDLSHKKLKKYALDEAIARKEVFTREIETLDVLARASDYKDPETGAHLIRVSSYAGLLAKSLKLDDAMQELVIMATPLHDIGKLGIPDSILLKPGRLTEEEIKIVQSHTTIGYSILQNLSSKYLKAGAVIALSHHERFDGSGYPHGLSGEDIPIMGRIVSIVDVFDALTSNRPYKKAWPFSDAVTYISSLRGRLFDPELVDIFLSHIDEFKRIHDSVRE